MHPRPRHRACRRSREAEALDEPAQKWAIHLAAAGQFYERERHLKVPRKHIEAISVPGTGDGQEEERPLKLGAWVANQRTRASTLTPERAEQLSAVGMRWT
ncbi:helicase associated domain-containing protein [Streptomyces sp. NPDC060209]|uniref:helicase associated domain-containing protein n=1 Tax=Streptomyces sp. NPDC060209 TaxID=3347073 RepID=UPI00364600AB